MVSPPSVGRITCQAMQRPGILTLPHCIKASFEPRTSGDTTPNTESRTGLNPGIEVEQRVQGPDDTDLEPSVPEPIAVRCSI